MTIHQTLWYQIPTATADAARAAFPKGNRYLTLYDHLGPIFTNPDFADLYVPHGRPAESPARLAMVLVLAHSEGLSDAEAAEAVRARLDWKYLLALPLDEAGFDDSILGDFRARLIQHAAAERLLTLLLDACVAADLLRARGRQRSDSTHVLAHMRTLSRLALVADTVRAALNDLADVAPAWLRSHLDPAWAERYLARVEDYRLPRATRDRDLLVTTVGQDGVRLLTLVDAADAPPDLGLRPALITLRRVWIQQYDSPETLRWRTMDELPPHALLMTSPYETDARFATKRETSWTGYKAHLTESCDDDQPHLITNVETTPATTNDVCVTPAIHTHLAERDLLPCEHLLDAGYVAADVLVDSRQDHQVDVIGPVPLDQRWQARQADGLDVSCFAIDWEAQQVTCPTGKVSQRWTPTHAARGTQVDEVKIQFAAADCAACPLRARCTKAATGPRTMTLRPQDQHAALQTARQRQTTEAFKRLYAPRSGIEGTRSQGVRAMGLRVSRYKGLTKTHLHHILVAVAINLVRLAAWFQGAVPRTTRQSHFARLVAASI